MSGSVFFVSAIPETSSDGTVARRVEIRPPVDEEVIEGMKAADLSHNVNSTNRTLCEIMVLFESVARSVYFPVIIRRV
jgi:hypothetical protein